MRTLSVRIHCLPQVDRVLAPRPTLDGSALQQSGAPLPLPVDVSALFDEAQLCIEVPREYAHVYVDICRSSNMCM